MSRVSESIDRVNSLVRTLLAMIVVGGVSVASWFGYSNYTAAERNAKNLVDARVELREKDQQLASLNDELVAKQKSIRERDNQIAQNLVELQQKDAAIDTLNVEVAEKQKQIDWLDTALRLMKVTHRVAQLRVVEQLTDEATGRDVTVVEFVEVSDGGQPLEDPRQFRIQGDVVFVDSWIVKFDDTYIEQADEDRSTSLCLFRRIFGESQKPIDGFELDQRGARPTAYARGGRETEFERKIWDDFWAIANDEARAKEMGIRAAHGTAISIKAMPGKTYKITLRASGDLSFEPMDSPPSPTGPTSLQSF